MSKVIFMSAARLIIAIPFLISLPGCSQHPYSVYVVEKGMSLNKANIHKATISNKPGYLRSAHLEKERDDIEELKNKYFKGDLEAAYQLITLLNQQKRFEEAEVVMDYAARKKHIPSMLMYADYFNSIGDSKLSLHWLRLAAKEGSNEASNKLTTLSKR